MENALLIFIKNPELGKAKTRLAATLGKEKALEIYLLLLSHTREVTLNVDAQRHLFYSQYVNNNDEWSNAKFQKHLQDQNPDLGQKMYQGFKQLYDSGAQKVVIIGSDCLDLTTEIIDSAFNILDTYDSVIGPAKDGGYYSIGFNFKKQAINADDVLKKTFLNKRWSHETVCLEAQEALDYFSLSYSLLPTLSDVDVQADVEHLLEIKNCSTSQ